jgi:hypothetical protein
MTPQSRVAVNRTRSRGLPSRKPTNGRRPATGRLDRAVGSVLAYRVKGSATMNVWKVVAVTSTFVAVLSVGYQAASARTTESQSTSVAGDFRRMRAALEGLRSAREHLLHSEHNHGGWRERAIENTDRAIHETEAAMNWSE